MRAKIIASIKRRGFDVHYWAERDAADKLTIVHRSELYSRAENAPERGWRGKIEFYSKRRRGRYVLQVVTGVGKEHRLEFNLYEGADENVFVIRYINLKEIRDVDFVPALPLPLPDTEEKFWQFATEWAQSLRDLNPAVPAVPARRRGRPRGDARIAAQQRKRVRLFLAEYLGAGKTIEEATATVVNKYGVNRR